MTDRLLTTREVGELLGLSPSTVLRRWRAGSIPGGVRLASNVLRFRESRIEVWLDDLEGPALTSVGSEVHDAGHA